MRPSRIIKYYILTLFHIYVNIYQQTFSEFPPDSHSVVKPVFESKLIVSYIAALNLPVAKIKDLGVCWNDCFLKVFVYKRFESVKEVQYFYGELSLGLIYELQRWKFLSAANKFCDRFSCLYDLQSHTVSELKTKFGDTDSVARMKQLVHVYFGRLFE